MTSEAQATMQHNPDMVTHALITKLFTPAALWIIGIGLLVIAFEILKNVVRKLIKKRRAANTKR